MDIINFVVSNILKARLNNIEHYISHPHEVQKKIFHDLINRAAGTEWGKKYNYKNISKYSEYREQVPLMDYEAIKPWIDRTMKGEQNLLWPEPIKWFAKSSGTTTGKSKFIPVSESSLHECHFKAGTDMLTLYLNQNKDSKLFSGKSLTLGGSHRISELNNESRYGDLSAVLIQNLPSWAMFFRTPGIKVALMDNWEEKIEAMAQETIPQNITNIVGVSSWTLVLAKKILEITGKNNLLEVWPNLEFFRS